MYIQTNTDWTRNKNSTAIIYQNANGSITEITLELFLSESPTNTAEVFEQLKTLSDKLFQDEDLAERKRAKNETPFYDWTEISALETLEEQVAHLINADTEESHLNRRKQMLALVPDVLNKLTEVQRRRFLLNKVNGVTTRKIANMEDVSQQSIFESITGAEKKIEKFLLKSGLNSKKHPVMPVD